MIIKIDKFRNGVFYLNLINFHGIPKVKVKMICPNPFKYIISEDSGLTEVDQKIISNNKIVSLDKELLDFSIIKFDKIDEGDDSPPELYEVPSFYNYITGYLLRKELGNGLIKISIPGIEFYIRIGRSVNISSTFQFYGKDHPMSKWILCVIDECIKRRFKSL